MKLKAVLTLSATLGMVMLWTAHSGRSDWVDAIRTLMSSGISVLREIGRLARWALEGLPLECVGGLACLMLTLSGLGLWAIRRRERVVLM